MHATARRRTRLLGAAALLLIGPVTACGGPTVAPGSSPAETGEPATRTSNPEPVEPRTLTATDDEGRTFELEGVEVTVRPNGDVSVDGEVTARGLRLPHDAPWTVSEAQSVDLDGDGSAELLLMLGAEASEFDEDDGADSGVWSTSELHLDAVAFAIVDRQSQSVSAEIVDLTYSLIGDSSTMGATAEAIHFVCDGHGRPLGPSWRADCGRCEVSEAMPRHPDAQLHCETAFDRRRLSLVAGEATFQVDDLDGEDSECSCLALSVLAGR